MKRTTWFCKSNLFILIMFPQLHVLFALSSNHFGDCLIKKCGDLDIFYPFYITNQQKPYCGYPGFEVSCNKGGFPVMNISGNDYVIRNISYETQNFEVVNSAFAIKSNCFDSIKNFSLERNAFQFPANHSKAYLFPNCSKEVVQKHKENRVKCGGIAVDGKDPKLKEVQKECNGMVKVLYNDEGVKNASIEGSLETGMVLNWKAYNCSACIESGGQCGFDVINSQFNCYCPDRTHAYQCSKIAEKKSWLFGRIIAGSALCGAIVLIVITTYAKRRMTRERFTNMWNKEARRNQNVEAFLRNYGSLTPKRYTNAEIKKMTNIFSEKLGEGGFGAVYKGQLQDSRFVAVKKLKELKGDGDDFLNEVVSISRTNHVNIVSLLGFCFEGNKRALVYEFMPNESLEKFIAREARGEPLPSETLFGIALGIAKGLNYLHRGFNMRIVHFDIKPHNVLLDEQLCPKISDFGLAKLCPAAKDSSLSMTRVRGTIGYIAPEVFCRNFGGVSHKSDVYSYGMMLLDMVCGRKNVVVGPQKSSEMYFPDWIYHQLELQEESEIHEIMDNQEFELQRKMILVGLWCIQTYPSNRPAINGAIEMLEGPLDSLQVPPKPLLSPPPHSVLDSSGTQSVFNVGY